MICVICKNEFQHKNQNKQTCSKKCRYKLISSSQTKNIRKFLNITYERIGYEKLKQKIEKEYHAPLMIWDLLKRDHPDIFDEFKNISLRMFRNAIKKDFNFNMKKYNKQQNYFKLQYKYPKHFTVDDLKKEQKKLAQKGQKETVKIRKSKSFYNPLYSKEYWFEICNGDEKKAREELLKYKKSLSPFSVLFYTQRGYSKQEAKNIISEKSAKRGLMGLKKTQKPKTERIIENILEDLNIIFSPQFVILLEDEEKIYRSKQYIYDFYIKKLSLVIECQGNYWHANPLFFNENDEIYYPGSKFPILAKDIWKRDEHKKKVALNRGLQYIQFWENNIENGQAEKKLVEILRN